MMNENIENNIAELDEEVLEQVVGGKEFKVKVDEVNVRSGPGTYYSVAAHLYNGAKVEILEQKTVGSVVWGRTEKGWVSMAYIVLDQPAQSQTGTRTVTADCLRIRSSASTSASVTGYLYRGSKVEILETKTVNGVTWGKVSKGWISLEYTE